MQGTRSDMRPVASTGAKKTLLLALAERWLDLADTEDKRAKAGQPLAIDRDERRRVSEASEGRIGARCRYETPWRDIGT